MASREFTDSENVVWHVWDVTTSALHSATRAEDYMGDFADGWLTFQSADEKRRLAAPYPADWPGFEVPELEALCRRAAPVVARGRRLVGDVLADTESGAAKAERAEAERTFTSPRGRSWC